MNKSKNNSEHITSAILNHSKKSNKNKKKQKLADGGEVLIQSFDYNTLSDADKKAYDALTPDQQSQVRSKYDANGNYTSSQGDTSTLSSAGAIGGIISAIAGVVDTAAGETDEAGQSDSSAQAALQGISNSASGANISTTIDQLSEGDYALSALNFLSPGAGEMVNQEKSKDEYEKAKKEEMISSAYAQKRSSGKFADGGNIPTDDPNKNSEIDVAKEISNYMDISSPKYSSDVKTVSDSLNPNKRPAGRDASGNIIFVDIDKPAEQRASLTPRDYKPQTDPQTINYLRDLFGADTDTIKSYDKKSDNYKNYLEDIIQNWEQPQSGEYSNVKFNVTKNSSGNYTLGYGKLDANRKQESTNIDSNQKLAEGGEITGKGTGKSDSINAELPPGSYILPADAPDYVTKRITKYLGYDDAQLNHTNGKSVKVSDGEILILPEDVGKADEFVRRLGYDNGLDELAPNAKHKMSERPGYADGGQIENYAGYIGGAGQLLLSMFEAGKNEEPKSNTEQMLRNLSNEVRLRAEYGLNPYERTQAERQIDESYMQERNIINSVSSGSADVILNNSAAAAIRANNSRLALEVNSTKLQEDKERYADEITMKAIAANEQEFQRKYDKYIAGEENVAGLLNAGIGNIIGQSQKNQYQNALSNEKAKDRSIYEGLFKNVDNNTANNNSESDNSVERIISQNTSWLKDLPGKSGLTEPLIR